MKATHLHALTCFFVNIETYRNVNNTLTINIDYLIILQ